MDISTFKDRFSPYHYLYFVLHYAPIKEALNSYLWPQHWPLSSLSWAGLMIRFETLPSSARVIPSSPRPEPKSCFSSEYLWRERIKGRYPQECSYPAKTLKRVRVGLEARSGKTNPGPKTCVFWTYSITAIPALQTSLFATSPAKSCCIINVRPQFVKDRSKSFPAAGTTLLSPCRGSAEPLGTLPICSKSTSHSMSRNAFRRRGGLSNIFLLLLLRLDKEK